MSMRMFVVAAPLLLASQAMFLAPGTPAGSLPTVLLQGLAGIAAVGAVLGLAHVTVLRHRSIHPVNVAVVVAVGAIAGIARALTGTAITVIVAGGSAEISTTLGRMISAALTGAVLLPLGAWAFASVDGFRHARAELVRTLSRSRLQAGQSLAQAAALRSVVHQATRVQVKGVADTVLKQVAQHPDDDAHAAAALMSAVDERIRPLSHDMWSSQPTEPRMHWSTAALAALRSGTPPVLPVLSLLLVMIAPRELTTRSMPSATIVIVLCLGWIGVALVLLRALPRRWRGWASTLTALALASIALAGTSSGALDVPLDSAVPGALAVFVAAATLTIVSAIVIAATREADTVLEHLQSSIDEAEVARRAADELRVEAERMAAGILHAQVQGTLLAAATTLSRGGHSTHEPWLTDLLTALPSALDSDGADTASVVAVCDAWRDLLEVDIDLPESLPDELQEHVALIAREGLANAFRHGQASRVFIQALESQGAWTITVDSDGRSPVDDPSLGLGLMRVERVAHSWHLGARVPDGARLSVALRVPE